MILESVFGEWENDLERFWDKVVISPNGCWEWQGAKDYCGYGICKSMLGTQRVHRISYTLLCGKIKSGLVIDHLCRNTSCLNPQHLEAVTPNNIRHKRTYVRRGTHRVYKKEYKH